VDAVIFKQVIFYVYLRMIMLCTCCHAI